MAEVTEQLQGQTGVGTYVPSWHISFLVTEYVPWIPEQKEKHILVTQFSSALSNSWTL